MIALFENAVLNLLAAAGNDERLGYKYRKMETFPDDWSKRISDLKGPLNTPAAWVTFDGFPSAEEQSNGTTRCEARFWLVVMAQHKGNEEKSRHGGGGQPGSYQLAQDAIALLQGQTFDLGDRIEIKQMREVNRTAEMQKRKLSGYSILLKTALYIEPLQDGGNLAPFETFHANWDVPRHGNVGPQIPDDENADATDAVALEGDQS